MNHLTTYWLAFMFAWFIAVFVLIPPRDRGGIARFGFWLGLIQAFIILFIGQTVLKMFKINGDPVVLGIPIITSICWIPPAILFAKFFPHTYRQIYKLGYVLLWAVGTTVVQLLLEEVGMWTNLRWEWPLTFLVAIITHGNMAYVLINRKENQLF